jgi:uncharacterized protein YxeA
MEYPNNPTVGQFIEKERVLLGLCALLVMVTGGLYGIWNSRTEHTITRVDIHDQRLSTYDARLTIQEYETKRVQERGAELELRIRELERTIAKDRR